jgi:uncharacterized membrane protein YecN with MAPEG domain
MCSHANFTETVPFALLEMALLEYQHVVGTRILMVLGSLLLAGRLSHAYAFSAFSSELPPPVHFKFRRPGMFLTISYIVTASALLVFHSVKSLRA